MRFEFQGYKLESPEIGTATFRTQAHAYILGCDSGRANPSLYRLYVYAVTTVALLCTLPRQFHGIEWLRVKSRDVA